MWLLQGLRHKPRREKRGSRALRSGEKPCSCGGRVATENPASCCHRLDRTVPVPAPIFDAGACRGPAWKAKHISNCEANACPTTQSRQKTKRHCRVHGNSGRVQDRHLQFYTRKDGGLHYMSEKHPPVAHIKVASGVADLPGTPSKLSWRWQKHGTLPMRQRRV